MVGIDAKKINLEKTEEGMYHPMISPSKEATVILPVIPLGKYTILVVLSLQRLEDCHPSVRHPSVRHTWALCGAGDAN